MKLIKSSNRIFMYMDGHKIIGWKDNGTQYGPVLGVWELEHALKSGQ